MEENACDIYQCILCIDFTKLYFQLINTFFFFSTRAHENVREYTEMRRHVTWKQRYTALSTQSLASSRRASLHTSWEPCDTGRAA